MEKPLLPLERDRARPSSYSSRRRKRVAARDNVLESVTIREREEDGVFKRLRVASHVSRDVKGGEEDASVVIDSSNIIRAEKKEKWERWVSKKVARAQTPQFALIFNSNSGAARELRRGGERKAREGTKEKEERNCFVIWKGRKGGEATF